MAISIENDLVYLKTHYNFEGVTIFGWFRTKMALITLLKPFGGSISSQNTPILSI